MLWLSQVFEGAQKSIDVGDTPSFKADNFNRVTHNLKDLSFSKSACVFEYLALDD